MVLAYINFDEYFKIDKKIIELAKKTESEVLEKFREFDEISQYNHAKVLLAFGQNRVSQSDFTKTSGYGYFDSGRSKLDRIYAQVFKTKDALVRHNIICGTHAISLILFGLLKHNDILISLTGTPYETVKKIIGPHQSGSLSELGIKYKEIPLTGEAKPNFEEISASMATLKPKLALIQRSKGYNFRNAIGINSIRKICEIVKQKSPKTLILVDNCYGEFVEKFEPTEVGADLIVGSLIKNPGGGISESGGYIAGPEREIGLILNRLTAPGLGRDIGANFGQNKRMFHGFYNAPLATTEALKTAAFASSLFSKLGYEVTPRLKDKFTDAVLAIKFKDKNKLIKFVQSIQKFSPIDSSAVPQPWDIPGYDHKVIMASGGFTEGSSIELSVDSPIIEPYIAYLQGGLSFNYSKIALLKSASELAIL